MRPFAFLGLAIVFMACVGLIMVEAEGTLRAWNGDSSLWFPWPVYAWGVAFYTFLASAVAVAIREMTA